MNSSSFGYTIHAYNSRGSISTAHKNRWAEQRWMSCFPFNSDYRWHFLCILLGYWFLALLHIYFLSVYNKDVPHGDIHNIYMYTQPTVSVWICVLLISINNNFDESYFEPIIAPIKYWHHQSGHINSCLMLDWTYGDVWTQKLSHFKMVEAKWHDHSLESWPLKSILRPLATRHFSLEGTYPSRPTWGTTPLRNCAPLPQVQSIHGISYREGCYPSTRLPRVLRRFETALLYPRSNPWDIISGGLLPIHTPT
jgi:hypothetical protein